VFASSFNQNLRDPQIVRRIDSYDGQTIYADGRAAFVCGNYLGGGAAGSVYQAVDLGTPSTSPCQGKPAIPAPEDVAIKILNPIGFKNLPFSQIGKCIPACKGHALSPEQVEGKASLRPDNVWWLVLPSSRQVFACYEDIQRGQVRELPLPRCVEIWGLEPQVTEENNDSGKSVTVGGLQIAIPLLPIKYLKWLSTRTSVCREMRSMHTIGDHRNVVKLLQVMEHIQDSKSTLFLVLELVTGGELFERMRNNAITTHATTAGAGAGAAGADSYARRYFVQLLSGIHYCHEKGVGE